MIQCSYAVGAAVLIIAILAGGIASNWITRITISASLERDLQKVYKIGYGAGLAAARKAFEETKDKE